MNIRWFFSKKIREATDMINHVRKLRDAQRDILAPQALAALETVIQQSEELVRSNPTENALADQMTALEDAADKWLKRYPNPGWRENVEVFLVAIAVAMAIRTFFLQPFKIPTGSMQPTLYGVTSENLINNKAFQMPNVLTQFYEACAHGVFFHDLIAEADGEVVDIPNVISKGINIQPIVVRYAGEMANTTLKVWFAPDDYFSQRTGLMVGKQFKKGDSIVKFKEKAGDHLFVDRISYNFCHPSRGDIVVFKTLGIEGLRQDQFYIKRLVGLPGERVSIGEDRHVIINGKRLDASTPHFENVYGFDPRTGPQESKYSGHTRMWRFLEGAEYPVSPYHYLVFGDNTMNSLDSRAWGDFPQKNVIGRHCFVYWPISDRFGWGQK